ncbi:hypothetical protein SLEP1_g12397 [Rubroshorea leprosula]|uniref:Uncharacterized protein n=1 Tax=Rubroshorea leprosula TaxID=152421 RepID=A0AAV5IKE2_9ROSI|nr:hypothetical protein SLEP1_g12397 [Rubroshorea leprosula]
MEKSASPNQQITSDEKVQQTTIATTSISSSPLEVFILNSSEESDSESSDKNFFMASLSQLLPIKRGLSKYYEEMSRSFFSLSEVKTVEDIPKPEHPFNKKLRMKRRLKKLIKTRACYVRSRL